MAHKEFKGRGYIPKDPFTEDQKAFLDDRLTSISTELGVLAKKCCDKEISISLDLLRKRTGNFLREVRCLSIQQYREPD